MHLYTSVPTVTVQSPVTLSLTLLISLQGEGPSASLPPTLDPTMMRVHPQGWDQDGMLRLMASSVPASHSPGVVPARFWAAGFSFSRAQLITEVSLLSLLPTAKSPHKRPMSVVQDSRKHAPCRSPRCPISLTSLPITPLLLLL